MLFTSQSDKGEQKFESNIPPEPAYEIKSPQISVPLPLPPKSLEKVPLSEPKAAEVAVDSQQKPLQEPGAPDNPSASETQLPPAATKSDTVKTVEQTATTPPSTQAENKKPVSPSAAKPAAEAHAATTAASSTKLLQAKEPQGVPASGEKQATVTGWVVQVGSFSRKSNAEKLRDKLRKMGMASFVASGQSKGKAIYRVRVGPEIDRADAEKIQASIKAKTKLNGLVMRYP